MSGDEAMSDGSQTSDQLQLQQARPFQNRGTPVKPEEVLAELQKLHPEMLEPFPNEQGVLCIPLKDFYMGICGIKDSSARGKASDLHEKYPDLYNQIVSTTRINKSE